MTILECIECETGEDPVGSVIWMHGFGADGSDFEPIVPMLTLAKPLRFVFPNAPMRSISINGGAQARAWMDISSDASQTADNDIKTAVASIEQILDRELAQGFSANQITLAGFSQGGVVALELGLSWHKKLAGVMALSTYLHDHQRITDRVGFANIDTPIFMAHGIGDPVIPITRAITSREALIKLAYPVEWRQYAMEHQVCNSEIEHISAWLNGIYS